jgi:nucleoside-diphosphate-sugar epimerase
MKKMRIAVVGGTGKLGTQVVKELQSHGHEVRVLSRNSPYYRIDLAVGHHVCVSIVGCERINHKSAVFHI